MAELQEGWVRIQHPDLGGEPHECPLEAFEETWSEKGFKIVKDEKKSAAKAETKEVGK